MNLFLSCFSKLSVPCVQHADEKKTQISRSLARSCWHYRAMDQNEWKKRIIQIWYPLNAVVIYSHDFMKVPKIPYSDKTRPPDSDSDSRLAPIEILPRRKLCYRTGWRILDVFVTSVLSVMELYSVSCSPLMASILSLRVETNLFLLPSQMPLMRHRTKKKEETQTEWEQEFRTGDIREGLVSLALLLLLLLFSRPGDYEVFSW